LQHSKTSPFLSSRWPSHANSLHTLPPLHLSLIPLSVAAKTDQPSLSIVLSFLSFSVNQTPHFFLQPTDHNKPATHQVFPLSAEPQPTHGCPQIHAISFTLHSASNSSGQSNNLNPAPSPPNHQTCHWVKKERTDTGTKKEDRKE
jgi:hypothetical protein